MLRADARSNLAVKPHTLCNRGLQRKPHRIRAGVLGIWKDQRRKEKK